MARAVLSTHRLSVVYPTPLRVPRKEIIALPLVHNSAAMVRCVPIIGMIDDDLGDSHLSLAGAHGPGMTGEDREGKWP